MDKKTENVLIIFETGDNPNFCNGCYWAHLYDRNPDDPSQPIPYYCELFFEWMETQDYFYRCEKCKNRIINEAKNE